MLIQFARSAPIILGQIILFIHSEVLGTVLVSLTSMYLTASPVYRESSLVRSAGCWMMASSLYRGHETVSGRHVP